MSDQPDQIVVETSVKIPMRDGTLLDAVVWRPAAEGQYPVLVERVAYEPIGRASANGEYYAAHGYVVVAQSVRGAFASEGTFALMYDDGWGEHQDGYDTVEWAARQPWSSGQVGMFDGSYSGTTQYLVAPTRPPHLRALLVRQSTGDLYHDWVYRGGAFQLDFMRRWTAGSILAPQLGRAAGPIATPEARSRVERAVSEAERWLEHLPLAEWPPIDGLAPWYQALLHHPEDGPHWHPLAVSRMVHEIETPILHIGSWYDVFLSGTLRAYAGIRAHGRTETCRQAQRLIVGPWLHGPANLACSEFGAVDFGPQAPLDLNALRLRWYDHWLKEEQNGVMDGPRVTLFLMGTNRWLGLDEWPPAEVTHRPLYLASSPASAVPDAALGSGDVSLPRGRLTFDPPPPDDPPDTFTYDPRHPVPSLVTNLQTWPQDQRPIEDRVLTYTSEPLAEDLHVVGPVVALLHAASSALDTDWVVRLCDVYPDGRSIDVCSGMLRARYRDSFERPTPLEPGRAYQFRVDLRATAQTFPAGHRLRVHVTSSDFPRFDRNLNTGGPFGREAVGQVAANTVFHDAVRPSHLLLPLMPSTTVATRLLAT